MIVAVVSVVPEAEITPCFEWTQKLPKAPELSVQGLGLIGFIGFIGSIGLTGFIGALTARRLGLRSGSRDRRHIEIAEQPPIPAKPLRLSCAAKPSASRFAFRCFRYELLAGGPQGFGLRVLGFKVEECRTSFWETDSGSASV